MLHVRQSLHSVVRHQPPTASSLCRAFSHCGRRYADRLAGAHDAEHLGKFEELLEAAIDLDRIPDEYLIAASYDPQLQARHCWGFRVGLSCEVMWERDMDAQRGTMISAEGGQGRSAAGARLLPFCVVL